MQIIFVFSISVSLLSISSIYGTCFILFIIASISDSVMLFTKSIILSSFDESIAYHALYSLTLSSRNVPALTTIGVSKNIDSYSLFGSAILTFPEVVS